MEEIDNPLTKCEYEITTHLPKFYAKFYVKQS